MSQRIDTTPTDPAGWRTRAAMAGWVPGVAKFADLIELEEKLSAIETDRLRGVRVKSMQIEAWWTIEQTIRGTDRDGKPSALTTERYVGTFVRHHPPAESVFAAESASRPWCPSHVFACCTTVDRSCGWLCTGTKHCNCASCLYVASYGGTVESRLNLVFYPPRWGKKVAFVVRPSVAAVAYVPKTVKAPKPKDRHWRPGQLALLPAHPSR